MPAVAISTELASVWGIFLPRQFFQSIPRELEDTAQRYIVRGIQLTGLK